MAKVTFEFKRDFAKRIENGVMEGIAVDVHVDLQGDENSPTAALATLMANSHKEIANLVMAKLVEAVREMGEHAEGGVYQRSGAKH